ncbi:hypothetical protein C8J57DRAFT_1286701 [Mycena rebaudengoi]|nr:hypothetical protein C8J57DRAFT_1286701 [Mycena rebaudengoi]
MPRAPPQQLAPRNGVTILLTQAKTKYRLAATDLASILSVSVKRNPNGGRHPMKTYNVVDVEALAARLRAGAATAPPSGLATPTAGGQIMRTHAMQQFNLTGVQLDRLVPVREIPNNHKHNTITRFYNRSDVQRLADEVNRAAAAPARPAGVPQTRYNYNVFDGMPGEDAALLLARVTGITGPAMAYMQGRD